MGFLVVFMDKRFGWTCACLILTELTWRLAGMLFENSVKMSLILKSAVKRNRTDRLISIQELLFG